MTPVQMAKSWHGLTCLAAVISVVAQFVLVLQGEGVLDETNPPAMSARMIQFFSYFTIQANLLVAVVCGQLAIDPDRDGKGWRAARLAAVIGIAVTGVVHLFLLRPLMNLQGVSWWVDFGLHAVVPLVAVVGWLAFGPRPRVEGRTVGLALVWPVLWLVYTLVAGQIRDWYPYPFIDVSDLGLGRVLLNAVGVTALFLAVAALLRLVDRRFAPAPASASAD